jgi:hypothetical protein
VTNDIDLQALGLVDEELPEQTDLDALAEEPTFEMPQPGKYVFTLPAVITYPAAFKVQPDGKGVQRIQAVFRKGKDAEGNPTGEDFRLHVGSGRLSINLGNMPMGERGSKLSYLLKACRFGGTLRTNADYIKAVIAAAGTSFQANLIYTANNKDTKERYSSRPWKSKDGSKEAKPIPRGSDGKYPQEFVDAHGVTLRCFPDLENFSPAD